MTNAEFRVPYLFDYIATFAWASSGAVVGMRKHFDIVGVFVIALLSAAGGGLMRDAIFLQRTPAVLSNPAYLPVVLVATTLVSLFMEKSRYIPGVARGGRLVDLIDALGMPAFAVIGMQLAEDYRLPISAIVFVGIVNGVSGGLLRDIVVSNVPDLLRPGQYQTLILLCACVLFQILKLGFAVKPTPAAWITVAAFFFVRAMALRFNWRSRSVLRPPEAQDHHDRRGT